MQKNLPGVESGKRYWGNEEEKKEEHTTNALDDVELVDECRNRKMGELPVEDAFTNQDTHAYRFRNVTEQ
ncbi:hypothetical protein GN958_ATG01808 [Phytophthora infestans]|uniref:Uncharacterized protein n=1 Tax=Phytophthora infestans TaxID=4787 RepID=A0A8S9VCC0_PHYIN|nr:hypothetical protein GN958_ATG01808 [Phytophthora infestans]